MAGVQEVISLSGSLEDLIPGDLTLIFTSKNSTEQNNKLTAGIADNEIGTNYNGATYDASAKFTGDIQGKRVIALSSDGSYEVLTMWPAVDNIPNGSVITMAAIYKEVGTDDGKAVDNTTGPAKNYFKYTLTW